LTVAINRADFDVSFRGVLGMVSSCALQRLARPIQDSNAFTAVLQLLYTEATQQSGLFLKKKPPSAKLVSAYVLENRSNKSTRYGTD
jgi:hypothetical protein